MRKALLLALMFSCTAPERAKIVLESSGYTHVTITGYRFNDCSHDDSTCTGFTATSPGGQAVTGAVGCGYSTGCSKGCTIRID